MTSPVIYAAAYLLLIGPTQADTPQPQPEPDRISLDCQQPQHAARPPPGNHISVRWRGGYHPPARHHRHHHHHRGWRFDDQP
jgi:hypothetical protein